MYSYVCTIMKWYDILIVYHTHTRPDIAIRQLSTDSYILKLTMTCFINCLFSKMMQICTKYDYTYVRSYYSTDVV